MSVCYCWDRYPPSREDGGVIGGREGDASLDKVVMEKTELEETTCRGLRYLGDISGIVTWEFRGLIAVEDLFINT